MSYTADIILADPAWTFAVYSKKGESRKPKYRTCSIDEMAAIPVKSISHPNTLLMVWVTDPMIPQALDLIDRWGFSFRTVLFYWIKEKKANREDFQGTGYVTRANPEQLWFCRRKDAKKMFPRHDMGMSRLFREQVLDLEEGSGIFISDDDRILRTKLGTHSTKPEQIQERIERLFGNTIEENIETSRPIRRVELFARRDRPGWICSGDELDGMDHIESIPLITQYGEGYRSMREQYEAA